MSHLRFALLALAVTAHAWSCDLTNPADVSVDGTVRHYTIEMGFWAVRGDDSVTYDPVGGLPAEFQTEGLRVHLVAKRRSDLVNFHMVGPIVEIISLRRL